MSPVIKRIAPILLVAAACLASADGPTASKPAAADLLNKAVAQAKQEHKFVFVEFHASWCIWCKRLGLVLNDPSVAPFMDANFVTLPIDVFEHDAAHAADETPGGVAWMEKLGNASKGQPGGIPFFVVIDDKGNTVLTSTLDGTADGNMGYPSEPKELDRFFAMLAAPGGTVTDDMKANIISLLKQDMHIKFDGDKPIPPTPAGAAPAKPAANPPSPAGS